MDLFGLKLKQAKRRVDLHLDEVQSLLNKGKLKPNKSPYHIYRILALSGNQSDEAKGDKLKQEVYELLRYKFEGKDLNCDKTNGVFHVRLRVTQWEGNTEKAVSVSDREKHEVAVAKWVDSQEQIARYKQKQAAKLAAFEDLAQKEAQLAESLKNANPDDFW